MGFLGPLLGLVGNIYSTNAQKSMNDQNVKAQIQAQKLQASNDYAMQGNAMYQRAGENLQDQENNKQALNLQAFGTFMDRMRGAFQVGRGA